MKVVISATLDSTWITDEQAKDMTDKEIVELCQEDIVALLDGAEWLVVREQGGNNA